MELRLEIKLASVEELSTVAKALAGLQVGDVQHTPTVTAGRATGAAVVETEETTGPDEMIEVESPYKAHPSETKPNEDKATKVGKAPTAAEKKAQEKAEKKAKEDAEREDRVKRLKEQMNAQKEIGNQALAQSAAIQDPAQPLTAEEPMEAIVEDIKSLGDKLMAFQGITLEAKQKLTSDIMAKVGVPAGVRPTQLQQPQLGIFRNIYKAAVTQTTNPVMSGLV